VRRMMFSAAAPLCTASTRPDRWASRGRSGETPRPGRATRTSKITGCSIGRGRSGSTWVVATMRNGRRMVYGSCGPPPEPAPLGTRHVWVSHLAALDIAGHRLQTLTSGMTKESEFFWCPAGH